MGSAILFHVLQPVRRSDRNRYHDGGGGTGDQLRFSRRRQFGNGRLHIKIQGTENADEHVPGELGRGGPFVHRRRAGDRIHQIHPVVASRGCDLQAVTLHSVRLRLRAPMDIDVHIDGQASMFSDSTLQERFNEDQSRNH